MFRLGWQMAFSIALWIGMIVAGCYNSHDTDKSSVQTGPEQESERENDLDIKAVGNPNISSQGEPLHIEMQADSARVCPGECVNISVDVRGGNPPYHFSWDEELSSVTTRGPHAVCPKADTTYTVTVRDTGLDSKEFVILAKQFQESTTITIIDDCSPSVPLDTGVDAGLQDANQYSDTEAPSITDASEDSINDASEGVSNAPCFPNCPDVQWVTIPGGVFMMGSAEGIGDDMERPQHEVTVQTFKMSKTEITVAQYGICVNAGVCDEPSESREEVNWYISGRESHPVNNIDWYQAKAFADWIDARLPSEAEWEYAARSGGQDILYPWGNEEEPYCDYVVDYNLFRTGPACGINRTMEVCTKPMGNTAQGLCNMADNVEEWIEDDWHESYIGAPSDGNAWIEAPRGEYRVTRGGSKGRMWSDFRSSSRHGSPPDFPLSRGFRIVLDAE